MIASALRISAREACNCLELLPKLFRDFIRNLQSMHKFHVHLLLG